MFLLVLYFDTKISFYCFDAVLGDSCKVFTLEKYTVI